MGNVLSSGDGIALRSDVGPIRAGLDRAIIEDMKVFAGVRRPVPPREPTHEQ